MDEVFVIILNWNGARDTLACLDSLMAQEGVHLECIVVDNCSRMILCSKFETGFPQVHVIENERNLGFPAGNNVGIRYAFERSAKNIFILNNDTIVEPGMVRLLLAHLTPDVGVVTPAIFYASQPDRIWSIGGMIHPLFLEIVNSPGTRIVAGCPGRTGFRYRLRNAYPHGGAARGGAV